MKRRTHRQTTFLGPEIILCSLLKLLWNQWNKLAWVLSREPAMDELCPASVCRRSMCAGAFVCVAVCFAEIKKPLSDGGGGAVACSARRPAKSQTHSLGSTTRTALSAAGRAETSRTPARPVPLITLTRRNTFRSACVRVSDVTAPLQSRPERLRLGRTRACPHLHSALITGVPDAGHHYRLVLGGRFAWRRVRAPEKGLVQ